MNITNNTEPSNIDNPLIFAGLVLVPTLLMWLGLQFKVKTGLPKKFHLLLIYTGGFFLLIALIVAGEIFPGKLDDVKLNYRGDKIFFEERVWDKYYLYFADLKLRHKQLIYSGTSPANRVTPNPGKNIVLFTYRKNGDEREQTACLYDYLKHKYIYQVQLSSYLDKMAWSKDGDQLFFNSYLGLTALDLKNLRLKNETQNYHLLMNKGFSYDCFDWSVKGDQLIYAISSDLFLFDRNTGRNTKLKSLDLIKFTTFDYQEYFSQVFFINNEQSVLYSYQEGPEFPGKIAVFDLTTHTVKQLYDAPNPQETHAGNSITDLVIEKVLNDQYIIISEYDMVNEVEPQPYTVYLFNLHNQKSVQLFKTYNTVSTWDVNGMTQQMVCINNNRIKIIDLKPYLKKIAK
jgi:WD40 repeat protein